MKKKQFNHGGVRVAGPGKKIGRPFSENPLARLQLRAPVDVVEYLSTLGNRSAAIVSAVTRSKGYRDWKRSR